MSQLSPNTLVTYECVGYSHFGVGKEAQKLPSVIRATLPFEPCPSAPTWLITPSKAKLNPFSLPSQPIILVA